MRNVILYVIDEQQDRRFRCQTQEIEKYCYDNLETNCEIYGGLYQWDEMMQYSEVPGAQGICPDDWRIPTVTDWDYLANYLGGNDIAGSKMKSCSDDWSHYTAMVNSNESGFTGLPAGYSTYWHTFDFITEFTGFWTSNFVVYGGWNRTLSYNSDIISGSGAQQWKNRKNGFSVRCIKIQ